MVCANFDNKVKNKNSTRNHMPELQPFWTGQTVKESSNDKINVM